MMRPMHGMLPAWCVALNQPAQEGTVDRAGAAMNPGFSPRSNLRGFLTLDHEQLRPALDPDGTMLVIFTRRDGQAVPSPEESDASVDVYA
jgi:hypothetical protein